MTDKHPLIGARAKDTTTGIIGTITARCEYLTGTARVQLEGASTDGKPFELWLEEGRIELEPTA